MSSSLEAKIVVLGAQGVGKTSLVHRYVNHDFNPAATTPTVGASFVTKRVVDRTSDTVVRLQIWDTAGQERFRSISRLYYRGANACLLCYNITDEKSFQEMTGWLLELKNNMGSEEEPIVIHVVGTKSDIVALDPSRRRVPFERTIAYVAEQLYPSQASTPPPTAGMGFSSSSGVQSPDSKRSSGFWSQDIGWDCCHEISAKDGEGIDEVFQVITRKLVEQRNRRDAELARLQRIISSGEGDGLGIGGNADGHGSFRLGQNDYKRRSWLGFTPSMHEESAEVIGSAKKKGRCC